MGIENRGFASMDKARVREIASAGGRAVQARGTGHRWTAVEARAVGKTGGRKTAMLRRQSEASAQPQPERTKP